MIWITYALRPGEGPEDKHLVKHGITVHPGRPWLAEDNFAADLISSYPSIRKATACDFGRDWPPELDDEEPTSTLDLASRLGAHVGVDPQFLAPLLIGHFSGNEQATHQLLTACAISHELFSIVGFRRAAEPLLNGSLHFRDGAWHVASPVEILAAAEGVAPQPVAVAADLDAVTDVNEAAEALAAHTEQQE